MAYLIDKEKVLEAIDETEDLRGYAYTSLVDAIEKLPILAVERDCRGCFGASFGDCEECERYKFISARTEAKRRLVGIIERIDAGLDEYFEVVGEWIHYFKNREVKHSKRRKICEKIKQLHPWR